ncbi:MAG: fibronectin type III domain-containing protein, partial [Candidatus Marinimicrobia bacterium]|nr:fibronectin type III domain-containing protein [Candidatus Neomarinimicrobiota bacterium]
MNGVGSLRSLALALLAPILALAQIPPAAPTNLTATPGDAQITLFWSPNSEADFLRYRIYGGTSTAPTAQVDSTTGGINDTTTTITGLSNGTTYFYRITAVDSAGNESGYSGELNETPVDLTPPAIPTSLAATPGDQQITLSWSPNSESDVLRYRIYGGTTASPTTLIDSTIGGINDTTKTSTPLRNGTTYYYRITAVDSAGNESTLSEEVSETPVGLVAYYPFSGNANDESGNANHGTVFGATLAADRFGNANSAYSFDGTDDYVVVPSAGPLDFSEQMTISFWATPQSVPGDRHHIIEKYGSWFVMQRGRSINVILWITPIEDSLGATITGVSLMSSELDFESYTHVSIKYDSTALRLYLNGHVVTSLVETVPILP